MLQDIEHGRSIEIDALLGSVIELARLANVPTPHLDPPARIPGLRDLLGHAGQPGDGREAGPGHRPAEQGRREHADPAEHAESRELAAALRQAVTEVLSERQRRVFIAIVVDGVPLDALAFELGSTRNATYKMMFDARRKIRAHLVAHGYLDAEGGMP